MLTPLHTGCSDQFLKYKINSKVCGEERHEYTSGEIRVGDIIEIKAN